MNTIHTFLPRTSPVNWLVTLRVKQAQLRQKWQQARVQREEIFRITQELTSCTDRELADLGISRSEIPAVARGTFGRA